MMTLAEEIKFHFFRRFSFRFRQNEKDKGHAGRADGGIAEVDAVGGDGVDQVSLELGHNECAEPVEAGFLKEKLAYM